MIEGDRRQRDRCTRREFLARSIKAGLSAAAAASAAYWLYGADAPAPEARAARLKDYSLSEVPPEMAIIRGADRTRKLRRAMDALGGMGRFISRGDRVLLKVNAAFASPPSLGATSHPDLVAETARQCLAAGAREVLVTDNPINDPVSCFELSGIGPAARGAGARVVLPRSSLFRPYTVEGGRLLVRWPTLYEPLAEATRVIGIAPVKDHYRAGASMTLKNWYGLLGGPRNSLHQDIHTTIGELARLVRPTLVILDGTETMVSNGPTGGSPADLKPTRTLVVSTDPVAADTLGASLLDLRPGDLPYLAKAREAGAGTTDWQALRVHRAEVD